MSNVHRLRTTDRIFYVTVNLHRSVQSFDAPEYRTMIDVLEGFALCLIVLATATCGDAQGVCVRHLVVPGYPRLARMARLQGSVSVDVKIDADGTVASAKGSGSSKLLERAAEQNLRQWTFYPRPTKGGCSFTRLTIIFVYRLEGREEYYDPPPRVIMELPSHVQIISNPPEPQP